MPCDGQRLIPFRCGSRWNYDASLLSESSLCAALRIGRVPTEVGWSGDSGLASGVGAEPQAAPCIKRVLNASSLIAGTKQDKLHDSHRDSPGRVTATDSKPACRTGLESGTPWVGPGWNAPAHGDGDVADRHFGVHFQIRRKMFFVSRPCETSSGCEALVRATHPGSTRTTTGPSGYDFGYENRVKVCPLVSARVR